MKNLSLIQGFIFSSGSWLLTPVSCFQCIRSNVKMMRATPVASGEN
jgi:hypothetical protein